MRLAMLLLALPALVSTAMPKESGTGDYEPSKSSVLYRAEAPSLSTLGNDVLRFSRTPALGGRTYIFEVHAVDREWAKGTVRFFTGHPAYGWKPVGSMPIDLSRADFDALMRRVDAALARGDPASTLPDGAIFVCTDGPGYLTERHHAGKSQWLKGFCGENHPNVEIARAVELVIGKQLTRFFTR